MRTVEQLRRELPFNPDRGLTPEGVERSRQKFGSNRLTPLPREPIWKKFLEKFDEPIIKILLGAALLSMVVDLFTDSATLGGAALGLVAVAVLGGLLVQGGRWLPTVLFASALVVFFLGLFSGFLLVEGLAVMIAVILATGVAFLSEYQSDREFEKLNAQKDVIQVKVFRGGEFHTVLLDDVVVGDVIELEMGDEIPADGRLVKATELYVDQSLMTGESEPVHKRVVKDDTAEGFDQPGCVYRGTQVVDGVGRMAVAQVGDETYLGQIARRLSVEEEEETGPEDEQKRVKRKLTISKDLTPLQLKLKHLAELISNVGYVAAIAIFGALVVRGLIVGELRWPARPLTIEPGANVVASAASPTGDLLALVPADEATVQLRDPATGKLVRTIAGQANAVAFDPEGERLVTAGRDGVVRVWDAATGKETAAIDNPGGVGVTAVAFAPDGKSVGYGTADGQVVLWDRDEGRRVLGRHGNRVRALAFAGVGRQPTLATASEDGIKLWDGWAGEALEPGRSVDLGKPDAAIHALAFSPNGKRLAAATGSPGAHGEVWVWNTADRTVEQKLPSPAGPFLAVAFDSHDRLLAGGAAPLTAEGKTTQGGAAVVWDLERGATESFRLTHNGDAVTGLSHSSETRRLAAVFSAGADGRGPSTVLISDANGPFNRGLLTAAGHLLNYIVYMVIIIVVAVPEGLPMSVTVSLALAMQKMTRANSRVRQLVACETIGSATVICSDKTGTLTQNKMQVVRLGWDGRRLDRGNPDWVLPEKDAPWPRDGKPVDWVALNAAVNSTANLEEKQGKLLVVGNSTEGALLHWVREAGLDYDALRARFEPVYQMHFSSERKRMTTVIRYGKRLLALVKGAPEMVLERSTHFARADGGEPQPWTPETRQATLDGLRDSSAQAMRTLAFGYAVLPPDTPTDEDALHARREALEMGLVFAGFVAIRDPLRPDVKDAIGECRRAGIEVKMITGDNADTARAIAFDIGLIERRDAEVNAPDGVVMTSDKFNELSDDALRRRLPKLRVLARARPLDKFRMVKLLQELGEVVAVTGDGTNDAPALKKADVGLAMGIAGTEVAKEASKIVLLDDSFATIVKAVQWGRSLYENIQRFLQFQLTINVSALTIAFLGPFLDIRPPFTVLQLLWINVIMDTFASIALCSEPPRPGVMDLPPKKRDENILTRPMAVTIFATAAFFVVAMIALLLGMRYGGLFAGGPISEEFERLTVRQVSVFFTVYVFFQVWNQINCRSLDPRESGLWGVWKNPTFLLIAGTIAVVQALIVNVPVIGRVFEVAPLSASDWGWILLGTASVLVFAEVARRVRLVSGSA